MTTTGRRRGRQLTLEEQELWNTVAATIKSRRPSTAKRVVKAVAPPPVKSSPGETPPPAAKPVRRKPIALKPMGQPEPAITMINAVPPLRRSGLDGKREERFRKGELEIEARIDLHGMTLDVAHTVLGGFLIQARTRGARCILVITGKGGPTGEGALRRLVPRWLSEAPFAAMIASMAPAQARHGGGGAFYIYLRRKRV